MIEEKKFDSPLECGFDYLLYLPDRYEKEKKLPIVFFFHGMGERGADLSLVEKHGPPMLVRGGKAFDFILVSPQCPAETVWRRETQRLGAFVDRLVSELGADEDRVYITGLSMGGYAVWALVAAEPERYAAAVPVCGGGTPCFAPGIKDLPIWAFHGDNDTVVGISESKNMVEAVNAAGGNAKLTVYEGVGHNSWERAYSNPELYEWLLSQKRAVKNG